MDADTRVGIDVGGTFTDVVVARPGGVDVLKVPSTPDAPDRGVLHGLDAAEERAGMEPERVTFFAHGTTVATNALLEREWAETALVTTAGFRDVLEIGRQDRPDLYALDAEKPAPVVERDRRFEVAERLDRRGEVVDPFDADDAHRVARAVADSDAESVAVAFLFAFEDDAHERRMADLLREETDVPVSCSADVLPEIREYERTLATAMNAGLEPVMGEYLGSLETGVADVGIDVPVTVMASSGGTMAASAARERPVDTLLSGPAAGVQGAAHVASEAGVSDLLTMDMGGTSCDVSLVRDGDPVVTTEGIVGDYPLAVPMVDVHTIGAGGGSVAWVDEGGSLRVGPNSAGADPGPVCYGRGGTEPTVTDAQALLGRIDPGAMLSDPADESAISEAMCSVADPLGMSVEDAARGVVRVANANMERALRVVSVERGHDPREFALVAYGGAGPLHAAELAAALDTPEVVVPRSAGVLSALGLLITDTVYEAGITAVRSWSEVDPADLIRRFEEMEREGRDRLADDGFPPDYRRFDRAVDLRYRGQSFDLRVPVPDDPLDAAAMETATERFHERHERRYGHASPDEPVELVTVRLRSVGLVDPPPLAVEAERVEGTPDPATTRPVSFDGTRRETPVYDRAALGPGAAVDGPAVVEGAESTTVVPPGSAAHVDDLGNVVIEP
jgi:N-methylhydantoinase A